ncbi:Transposase IS200 like [Sporomusa acidovorans]|nr:hypothetical protein SPACI_28480 [Sporomusa acidovorans DSM 3132]SDF84084.1 Transposase IS200 like [Sporomusa acidovorans]
MLFRKNIGTGMLFLCKKIDIISSEVKKVQEGQEKSGSGIYHIIFEDDEDRLKLIEDLAKYKEINQCRIFAYCLMDNHVHFLL